MERPHVAARAGREIRVVHCPMLSVPTSLLVVAEKMTSMAEKQRIEAITLPVADVDRAKAFYERAAGWRSSSSGLRTAATWSYWRCATPPMVSTMTFDQLVDTYADHAGVDEDRARERRTGHLGNAGDPPELATRVKI